MSEAMWLAVLGSATGAGGLLALLKAYWDRKDILVKARNEHIEDLSKWRDEMHDMVLELQGHLEYYRSMAADFEYQLRSHGIEPHTTAVRSQTKEGS